MPGLHSPAGTCHMPGEQEEGKRLLNKFTELINCM